MSLCPKICLSTNHSSYHACIMVLYFHASFFPFTIKQVTICSRRAMASVQLTYVKYILDSCFANESSLLFVMVNLLQRYCCATGQTWLNKKCTGLHASHYYPQGAWWPFFLEVVFAN